jgi:hypothetical protein
MPVRKVRTAQGTVLDNVQAEQSDGKCNRKIPPREHRMRCGAVEVRVKWCGKSAPHSWRHEWHGKPHPQQDQIRGESRPGTTKTPRVGRTARKGRSRRGNARQREMAAPRLTAWNRIRLTRLPRPVKRPTASPKRLAVVSLYSLFS